MVFYYLTYIYIYIVLYKDILLVKLHKQISRSIGPLKNIKNSFSNITRTRFIKFCFVAQMNVSVTLMYLKFILITTAQLSKIFLHIG